MLFITLSVGIPSKMPLLWFPANALALVFYAVMARVKKDRLYTIAAIFLGGLAIAGLAGFTGYRWLHMLFIPYIVFVSAFFALDVLVAAVLFVPFFEIRHLLYSEGRLYEELSLIGVVALSGAASHLFLERLRKEKERLSTSLRELKDTVMESLSGENVISRGMALSIEAEKEIGDVLKTVRHTIKPDAVHLFTLSGGMLRLRCSTEENGRDGITLSDKGLIHISFDRKETIVLANSEMKHYNPGYARKGRVVSMASVPVMDGDFALGVLAADSERPEVFGDFEIAGIQMFSRHIAGILKKQRLYAEMERSHLSLKVLHEESARLVTSLNLETVTDEIIEGVRRIVPPEGKDMGIALFLKDEGLYELIKEFGLSNPKKRKFSIRNTLLEMAVKGKEHVYIPDLSGYSVPPLPFGAGKISSAFMLPLLYETGTIGIMAIVFGETKSLSPYQIEALDVFGNQASTSLKNAMLHANIERMATTDGLTGLFNHRQFQERLAAEFIRLGRFGQPLSLLLIDIDFFKKVNDTYGHPAGDAVLRAVADIIRKTVREVDMPARYGGEEFAALLIGTDKKGAFQTAERLRCTVRDSEFKAEDKRIRVTVSIGVSSVPADTKIKEEFIERADKALYQAKSGGRNKTVMWSGENKDA